MDGRWQSRGPASARMICNGRANSTACAACPAHRGHPPLLQPFSVSRTRGATVPCDALSLSQAVTLIRSCDAPIGLHAIAKTHSGGGDPPPYGGFLSLGIWLAGLGET